MKGFDLLVANRVELSIVQTAIAAALGMEITQIAVVDNIEDAPNDVKILCTCVVNAIPKGEFLTHLSIYTDIYTVDRTRDSVLIVFAKSFGCRCLVGDESLDPYAMTMVSPDGSVQPVSIEVNSLDDFGEYRIEKLERDTVTRIGDR